MDDGTESHAPVEMHGELCGWCIHGPPASCDCGADLFYGRLTEAGFTVARLEEFAISWNSATEKEQPVYRIVEPK